MTRRTFLLPLLLIVLCLLASASTARAQDGDHRAALIVRFGDGSVETRCVAFSEPSITGAELLARSGMQIIIDHTSGIGGAVCSIAAQGCAFPTQDCFCRCQGLTCEYWAYYHWVGGGWQYSQVGAGGYTVTDGALEGWSWGAGNFSSGVEPPALTFAEVCPVPATATPTATVTATPTATATPTSTVVPTQGPSAPPQVTFEAQATDLTPGACTVLSWWTSDASQLTLDGAPVNAQDQKPVCPAATQRFVLTAANAAGQTVREITVRVSGSSPTPTTVQPASTATHTPIASAVAMRSATPSRDVLRISTATPGLPPAPAAIPPASAAQPPATSEPPRLGQVGIAVAHAQEITPAATPIVPANRGLSSDSIARLVAPATSTPRPRRQLGADGRPTPTPILLAYVKPANSTGSRPAARAQGVDKNLASNSPEAPSRNFSLVLLPGYAAYLLTLASLVGAGVWVVRRKSSALRKS